MLLFRLFGRDLTFPLNVHASKMQTLLPAKSFYYIAVTSFTIMPKTESTCVSQQGKDPV